ncbi:MAG: YkvA family protein [Burkholderiaceae bacterium]
MLFRLRRLLKATGRELAVLWYACRHPGTPLPIKLGAVALAIYFFSPLDFMPDTLPLLGWVDDVTLLALLIPALTKLLPKPVLASAQAGADRLLSAKFFGRKPY